MTVSHHREVTYVECPTCHWGKAVLAYEDSRKRCFLCPHCSHVWDTKETVYKERTRLKRRTAELCQEYEVLKTKPFNQTEYADYKARLQTHLNDLQGRRRDERPWQKSRKRSCTTAALLN